MTSQLTYDQIIRNHLDAFLTAFVKYSPSETTHQENPDANAETAYDLGRILALAFNDDTVTYCDVATCHRVSTRCHSGKIWFCDTHYAEAQRVSRTYGLEVEDIFNYKN